MGFFFHDSGLSSGWDFFFMIAVSHQGGVFFHDGGLSSGWGFFMIAVSHQVFFFFMIAVSHQGGFFS